MKRPSATHIDLRRELDPRDYCVNPQQYGRDPIAQFRAPAGGDELSATIARLQHDLIIAFRTTGPVGDGSQDARALGVSSSTWRRSLSGQRWMGETVLAVVLRRLFPESHGDAGAVPARGRQRDVHRPVGSREGKPDDEEDEAIRVSTAPHVG